MSDSTGLPVQDEVRVLAERELGHQIDDREWEAIVELNYATPDCEAFAADEAVRMAVEETVAFWRKVYGKLPRAVDHPKLSPKKSKDSADLWELRRAALTALYVADARQDFGVHEFRSGVLEGKLLPGGEQVDQACRDWIENRVEGGWRYFGMLMERRFVADAPDDGKHYDMPEPLRELYLLTERLAKRYDWIKGAATLFVLADVVPEASTMRASGRVPYSWLSASRITLVVDPATSPEEVAAFYQFVRKSKSYFAGAQVRPLSEKSLLLAAFSAEVGEDERGAELVKRWNSEHPEHAYKPGDPASVSNFGRDMRQARERLLYPKLGLEANRRAQRFLDENRAVPNE